LDVFGQTLGPRARKQYHFSNKWLQYQLKDRKENLKSQIAYLKSQKKEKKLCIMETEITAIPFNLQETSY